MENFLIIRLSSLGDIIHTLPAFSALRKNYPQAKISWAVDKKGKEILDVVPGIDKIVVLSSKGWLKKIKNKNQVALDFQGLLKSALVAFFSRAKKRIGFSRDNLKEPLAALFYTDKLEKVSESQHVISKNLRLLTKIGINEERYEFPLRIPEEIQNAVQEKLKQLGFQKNKKLAIFNVGAAWITKRWPVENWIKVLKNLRKDDLFPLLLWGNEEERELAVAIGEETKVQQAPFFSIKEILALIKETKLLVSGDTFALQAGCAFSVPVVAIFGPTNPQRNGPFSPGDKVAFHKMECSFCYKRECPLLDCLKQITPEEVSFFIRQSLRENA